MMDWTRLISSERYGKEHSPRAVTEMRTEFQRDYDRLIFSAPFRRMQNKTQVFPLPGSVFVHNRLTHSLEVSSVGRSLGTDVARELIRRRPALADTSLAEKLAAYKEGLKDKIVRANAELAGVSYKFKTN